MMPCISYCCHTCGGYHAPLPDSAPQGAPLCDCAEMLRLYREEKGITCPACAESKHGCDLCMGTQWLSLGYLDRMRTMAHAASRYEYTLHNPKLFSDALERKHMLEKIGAVRRGPSWRPDAMLDSPTSRK